MTVKDINDLDEIGKDMDRLKAAMTSEVPMWVCDFIDDTIMPDSKEQCPFRTGELRRSATVNPAEDMEVSQGRVVIPFGYGTTYAVYVHEMIGSYHEPPTKAKFLEDPVLQHEGELMGYLDDRLASFIGVG